MDALNFAIPLPRPTSMTMPFWQAARQHRLIIQRCGECGKLRFYPSAGCDNCASLAYEWCEMSGRGRVYSWIVVRRTVDAAWQRRVPFVTGIIELVEQLGLLIPGLLTDIAPEDVRADLEVEAWFEDLTEEISMSRWRPRRVADASPSVGWVERSDTHQPNEPEA